jgi:ankyrin repeat protein
MRIWQSGSFLAFGTYMGTDKIGHFTDMGMNYWREYHKARQAGAAPDDAERQAVKLGSNGLILSERGLLGYMTAGAYSNGDMAANFLGLRFYRNLTETVSLWGQPRKPLLVRDGPYWRIAPDVDPNSFLAWFFDDRFDEALNPSRYEEGMRQQLRANIADRATVLRAHYVDRNGEPRARRWFERRADEFRTYYGTDYGHYGTREELILLSDAFYPAAAANAPDPKSRDAAGRTPLHVAALAGDTTAMRNLLRAGAEPSAPAQPNAPRDIDGGATPLHFAVREGAPDAVRLLLSVGARTDARDNRGETPLHVAAAVGDYETVDLLLSRGADPNARDDRGRTPLHRAATFTPEPGDTPAGPPAADRIITRLVAAGATVDARDRDGRTPLHDAARITNLPAIGALLIARANPAAADALGVTPLHVAAARDDARVVERMLRAGAPADVADQFGSTPLFEACRRRAHRAAALLVDHGADVARADAWGQTPLAIAGRLNDRTALATLQNARPHAGNPQPAGARLSNTSPQP